MMLYTGRRQCVAYRDEEIIAVVVMRSEQQVRLLYERAMSSYLRGGGSEQLGTIGKQIQVYRDLRPGVEIDTREVTAGVQRRVDQRLEGRRGEARFVARLDRKSVV